MRLGLRLLMAVFLLSLVYSAPLVGEAVQVQILDSAESPIREAYVALYAPHDTWSRPSGEALSEKGVAVLKVPPGSYRLFAGAPGYEPAGKTIQVAESIRTRAAIELSQEFKGNGTVEDEEGLPVRGASVSQVRVPFSELAQRHLGRDWKTLTDDNGWWTLQLPTEWVLPLLIEAPGFAPAWHVSRPADAAETTRIVLRKGVRLSVHLNRADEDVAVALRRVEPAAQAEPSEQYAGLWRRVAETTSLHWEGLPPGEYRLMAEPRDPFRFDPVGELARLNLVEPSTEIDVLLPLPKSTHGNFASIFLTPQGAGKLTSLTAWVPARSGGVQQAATGIEAAVAGTLVHVDTPAAPELVYLTSPEKLFLARPSPDELHKEVRPAAFSAYDRGQIRLRMRPVGEGVLVPESARALYRDCPRDEELSISLNVLKDGSVDIPAPADCRTLVLHPLPLGSIVVPIQIGKGETKWLGEFDVRPAAEADVRVARDPSGTGVPGASVRVFAQAEHGRTVLVTEVSAADDGRVLLPGLPAETQLILQASDPADGGTGDVRIELAAGEHRVIDPLSIPDPATLIVEPRLSTLFRNRYPTARISAVVLQARPAGESASRKSANLDGRESVEFQSLRPGQWSLVAVVEAEGVGQPIELEDVELEAGEVRRLQVEVEPLIFEGRVISRDKKSRWSVGIADPPAREAIRRRVQANPDGTFRAVLPHRGSYDVSLRALDRLEDEIQVGEIDFSDPSRPVEIIVPDASLVVNVRDKDRPAAGISVTLTLRRNANSGGVIEKVLRKKTDGDGMARFESLVPGVWIGRASDPTGVRTAEKSAVVLAESDSDLILDLEASSSLAGTVRDVNGQLAGGARVNCLFLSASGPFIRATTTSDAGQFSIDLPGTASSTARCAVRTRHGAIGAYLVEPSTTAALTLPAAVGSLIISDWDELLTRNRFWMVSPDGRLISLSWLGGGTSSPLLLSRFPAGSWKVVRADTMEQWNAIAQGTLTGTRTLADILLKPGDRKDVSLQE